MINIINCFEKVFFISLIPETFFNLGLKLLCAPLTNQIIYLNYKLYLIYRPTLVAKVSCSFAQQMSPII